VELNLNSAGLRAQKTTTTDEIETTSITQQECCRKLKKKARHKEAGRKNRLKTKQRAEADQRKAEAQLRKLERGRTAGQKFRDKKKAAMMEDDLFWEKEEQLETIGSN
jgi:hypothetical protein